MRRTGGASQTVRRTVYIPPDVAEETNRIVKAGKARNHNELMVMALRQMIAETNRKTIDAAFDRMGQDEEAKAEALSICREFEASDWEALQLSDREDSGRKDAE